MALRTVGVRLVAEISGYRNQLRSAATSTKEFASGLDQAARSGKLDKLADQAGRMGLGMVAAFGIAVGAAARFDKQMSEVGAVSDATGAQLNQLRQAALQAGKDTAFSATEAAKAEAELAKAGLSTADILGGALKGSMALAAAGTLDLAEAADISAKTMNVFNLEGRDVSHIADVLAASANKSATDVHEMGEALRMGGLAANAAGLSLEETAGTLAAFADNALVGSDAGTSLKSMLQFLAAPSEKSAKLMKELGINAYDAGGNFIGTARLAGVLQQQLGGLTQEQRNAALATIFGADAMRAANILFDLGTQGVQDYVAAVNDQGAAAEVAAKKMDNLAGDVERLKGSLETMAIEGGSGANAGLRQLVQLADGLVGAFSRLPTPLQHGAVMIAGIGGAGLLAFAGLIKMRRASAEALAELRAMGPAGERAAAGLQKAGRSAKIATAAFIGMEVFAQIVSTLSNAAIDVGRLDSALQKLGQSGKMTGELARVLGSDAGDIRKYFGAASDGIFQSTMRMEESVPVFGAFSRSISEAFHGSSFTQARENVKALDQQLASYASTTDDVSKAQAAYTRLLQASGLSADQFAKLMPAATEALHDAWQAADKAGKGQGDAGKAMADAGQKAEDAAKQVEDLKKAYDALFGATMSLDEANIAYQQGLVDLNDELKTGKRSLDINTKAGRDNVSAVLDQIDKINNLRQANIDNGMSVTDANKKYAGQIETLRKTLYQLGFNKTAVDALIGRYKAIPGKVYTDIKANTAAASKAIAGFAKQVRDLRGKTITIHTRFTSSGEHISGGIGSGTQVRNRWGGITEHAQSGLLREASMFSPRFPARFAFAEPATGGEAFVPKFGDASRSLAILNRAAGWYGAQLMPKAMTMRPVVYVTVTPVMSGGDRVMAEINRSIRYEVRTAGGGDVQRAYGG